MVFDDADGQEDDSLRRGLANFRLVLGTHAARLLAPTPHSVRIAVRGVTERADSLSQEALAINRSVGNHCGEVCNPLEHLPGRYHIAFRRLSGG